MITVSCGSSSSVVTAPSILALPSGETEYLITAPASTYTLLGAFTVTNANCGRSGLQIDQISGGTLADIQNLAA